MSNQYPDFISGNEKWKVERAIDLVNAYAAGYTANTGLHGGINQPTLFDLFKRSYDFLTELEKKIRNGEYKK